MILINSVVAFFLRSALKGLALFRMILILSMLGFSGVLVNLWQKVNQFNRFS